MKKPHALIVVMILTLVMLACTCNFTDDLMDAVAEIEPTATWEPTVTPTLAPTDTPTHEPTLGIGSTMVNQVDGAMLVYVSEGEFLMGSEDDEMPVHTVYLDAFWVYQHPVTNAQYRQCVEEDACELPDSQIYFQDPSYVDHPVLWVSWFDADAYCQWASGRMPTEAEWEKAARGTDRRRYPWGDENPTCSLANFYGCVGDSSPVGSYPAGASPYGALDMAGNVWEWVADWYAEDYYNHSPGANPTGPTSGLMRVFRGGSWGDTELRLWVSNRDAGYPDSRGDILGFRCLRSP